MDPTNVKEQLSSHFDKSARVVREYADRFETVYARPALKTTSTFVEGYPILATFLMIFCALAILPALTFVVVSLLTVLAFFFLAFCCACIVSLTAVLFFLSVLVSILIAIALFSAIWTFFVVLSYLTYRFVYLVRSNGREGVSNWAAEVKGRFAPVKTRSREGSDGSVVVVDVKKAETEPPSTEWPVDVKQEGY
ncbi:hypothetical protein FB45DRAFT_918247 [Roridomyces roridus]|uniref:Uncharacterized protein n=1 Tax=Roridomyces roridus TaxID=1738132 RepID=A0AAD7FMZ3_9AGAR|nr:hypothetical protein FB45DRAFT_918247 [Roridomyces roridus]